MSLKQLTEEYDSEYETQLSAKRMEELEWDSKHEAHPVKMEKDETPLSTQQREKQKLKWQMQVEVLTRPEKTAHTLADLRRFGTVGDKLDRNRGYRERYHEVQRGEAPLGH